MKKLTHTLQCKTGDKKQQKQVHINISAGLREAGRTLSNKRKFFCNRVTTKRSDLMNNLNKHGRVTKGKLLVQSLDLVLHFHGSARPNLSVVGSCGSLCYFVAIIHSVTMLVNSTFPFSMSCILLNVTIARSFSFHTNILLLFEISLSLG